MRESRQSRSPPLPGIILPLSFTSNERLKTDSIKSPIIAPSPVIKLIKIIFHIEPKNTSGNKNLNAIPLTIALTRPPKNPTRLLFGLALKNPLVDFPNRTPKNQAPESVMNTRIKYR